MKKVVVIALAAALAACGGGGSTGSGLPRGAATGTPIPTQQATATFTLVLPTRATATAHRNPSYVSSGTESAVVALATFNGTPVSSPQLYAVAINPFSGCTGFQLSVARSTLAVRKPLDVPTCTFSIPAPVGMDTFTVATYDALQSSATPTSPLNGNLLSTGTSAPSTMVNANAANAVTVTLDGVVAQLSLSVYPTSLTAGSGTPVAVTLTAVAQDAHNDVIGLPGSFANSISLSGVSSDSTAYAINPATLTTPPATGGTTTVTPPTCPNASLPTITFTASAAGVPAAPGVKATAPVTTTAVLSVSPCGPPA